MKTTPQMECVPIRTPFNRHDKATRSDRRIYRNGHWERVDPVPDNLLAWLREGAAPVPISHFRHD